jgi:hypothetical protein
VKLGEDDGVTEITKEELVAIRKALRR